MPEGPDASRPQPRSSILADPALVDVVLPRHLYRVFTYLVPAHLQSLVQLGSRVQVPFGHATLQGMVVKLRSHSEPVLASKGRRAGSYPIRLREIGAIADDTEHATPQDLMTLSRLIAEHYVAPWGQCIRLIFPGQPAGNPPARYQLTEAGRDFVDKAEGPNRLSPTCQALLIRLHRRPKGLSIGSLRHGASATVTTDLSLLKRRKLVQEMVQNRQSSRQRLAVPSGASHHETNAAVALPFIDQRETAHSVSMIATAWWNHVLTAIDARRPARFLLQGPQARRVSAVLEAAEHILNLQRRVIVITPEISRAETFAAGARTRWGDRVELFHGGLLPAVRHERWRRLQSGTIDVVVGTRSAIFAPISSVGLIYIDEEENSSLKEETEPRYHARDVAWMRVQLNAAVLLLGSAHPSLETMHVFDPGGCETPFGAGREASAVMTFTQEDSREIHLVNLRGTPYGTVLSDPMIAGMRTALEARAGVMLFLNRKGFAPALVCRECGNTPQCPRCSVALTFYKQGGRLACHYCATSLSLPDTCPSCHAPRLQPGGIGTEAVEEWTRRLFPHARIGRIDGAMPSGSKQASTVRRQFLAGELDVLIGTQMLCQGEPALCAGFVGLIQADAGLHLPDFRAGEHTYHTLMDVIALARPAKVGGQVVLQTLLPAHYVIQAVTTQDPTLFYKQELAFRRALAYPPLAHLISLRVSGVGPDRTRQAAAHWVERLKATGPDELTVWGPIPSAIARLRGTYRWQIIVKSSKAEIARRCVQNTLDELETCPGLNGIKFEVDVDPISTL
jgi:primosomal protein N' (replication factor Y) (superfamily II helicase)